MQCRSHEVLTDPLGSSRADGLSEESCTDRNAQVAPTPSCSAPGWGTTSKSRAFAGMLPSILLLSILQLSLLANYTSHSWRTSTFLKGLDSGTATHLNNVVSQSRLTLQPWRVDYLHWCLGHFWQATAHQSSMFIFNVRKASLFRS